MALLGLQQKKVQSSLQKILRMRILFILWRGTNSLQSRENGG